MLRIVFDDDDRVPVLGHGVTVCHRAPDRCENIQPVISVVIAVRDGLPWLEEQLGALAAQICDDEWEVVVADNGSTDGSPRVAALWSARGAVVRLIDASQRRGPSAARNIGADQARGEKLLVLRRGRRRPAGLARGHVELARGGRRRCRSVRDRFAERRSAETAASGGHAPARAGSGGTGGQPGRATLGFRGRRRLRREPPGRRGHRPLLATPVRRLQVRHCSPRRSSRSVNGGRRARYSCKASLHGRSGPRALPQASRGRDRA